MSCFTFSSLCNAVINKLELPNGNLCVILRGRKKPSLGISLNHTYFHPSDGQQAADCQDALSRSSTRESSGFSFINSVGLGFPYPPPEWMELASIPPPPHSKVSKSVSLNPGISCHQPSCASKCCYQGFFVPGQPPRQGFPSMPGALVCFLNCRSLCKGSEISFQSLFCMRPKLHPPRFFPYPYPFIKKQNEHHRKCSCVQVAVLVGSEMHGLLKANEACWWKHLG